MSDVGVFLDNKYRIEISSFFIFFTPTKQIEDSPNLYCSFIIVLAGVTFESYLPREMHSEHYDLRQFFGRKVTVDALLKRTVCRVLLRSQRNFENVCHSYGSLHLDSDGFYKMFQGTIQSASESGQNFH